MSGQGVVWAIPHVLGPVVGDVVGTAVYVVTGEDEPAVVYVAHHLSSNQQFLRADLTADVLRLLGAGTEVRWLPDFLTANGPTVDVPECVMDYAVARAREATTMRLKEWLIRCADVVVAPTTDVGLLSLQVQFLGAAMVELVRERLADA